MRHWRAALGLSLLGVCAACESGNGRARWLREGETLLRDGVRMGHLTDRKLDEASGLATSVGEPGVFWSQNDSGNDGLLFAYDSTGRALARVKVRGAPNDDWEAIAVGPCADGQCLTIADVGDNGARRRTLTLYQLAEPRTTASESPVLRRLTLRYADGPHDVEAMFAGADGSLWLVTKRPSRGDNGAPRPVRLYHVPRAAWEQAGIYTAAVLDSLPVTPERGSLHDWVTDASLSPQLADGSRRVVLLSYGAVHVFAADATTGRPGARLGRCTLPIPESSAEGITWLPDGRLLVVTEGKGGALYAGRCP